MSSTPRFAVSVDQVGEQEWSGLLERFADANFYQTWAYGAVSWGDRQLSHCVLRQEGEAVALAQLRIVKVPLVRAGIAHLRWGPICWRRDRPWDGTVYRQMLRALVAEYVERRRLVLRVIPNVFVQDDHAPDVLDALQECGFHRENSVAPYRTLCVDLRPDLDTVRKRLDGKWRNQLNAAERNELTVHAGTGPDLYERFLGLHDEMMARKSFDTTVDPRQFGQIQERLPVSQKMVVMISARNDVAQTGLVTTAVGDTGIYLLGATSNDGMKSKGSYLLQWRMMTHLKEQGCRWYDLGGINPEKNPGVYHFKQGMGGEEVLGLGRFACSRHWLNLAAVTAAERLQGLAARLRGSSRA